LRALKDTLFKLTQRLAVPPNFGAAYQRRALIVVEFLKATTVAPPIP
jgi:hypothetical protein